MSTFIFATTRRLSIAHLLSLFVLHPPWYERLFRPPTLSNDVLTFLCFQRRLGSSNRAEWIRTTDLSVISRVL